MVKRRRLNLKSILGSWIIKRTPDFPLESNIKTLAFLAEKCSYSG